MGYESTEVYNLDTRPTRHLEFDFICLPVPPPITRSSVGICEHDDVSIFYGFEFNREFPWAVGWSLSTDVPI